MDLLELYLGQLIFIDNMHKKAKDRIKEAENKPDERTELASKLPKKGDKYINLMGAIERLCDDVIDKLKPEEKSKVAKLRSRIKIELS